jgi:hypothetical protein
VRLVIYKEKGELPEKGRDSAVLSGVGGCLHHASASNGIFPRSIRCFKEFKMIKFMCTVLKYCNWSLRASKPVGPLSKSAPYYLM